MDVTMRFSNTTPEFRRFYRSLRAVAGRYEANISAAVAAQHLGGADFGITQGITASSARPADGARPVLAIITVDQ